MKAPFPYFGGKSAIVDMVWNRLGADVTNYVEPFAGSAAMLLNRPGWAPDVTWTETINDADGFVANFWRATRADPQAVAHHADWPVNENDLHARHAWLVGQRDSMQSKLEGNPNFYDPKIAGWWVWGMSCWIGGGFCSGRGPWGVVDGELVKRGSNGMGVRRQRVHLGNNGRGVNRQRVHLSDGTGDARTGEAGLLAWIEALAQRLRLVRVASGDWSRVCGPTPTVKLGTTAVFLDPPYSLEAQRHNRIYRIESGTVAHDVREWAIQHGDDSRYRIALCGYDSEHGHMMPDGWEAVPWNASGGYANMGDGAGRENASREVVWFSPHCKKEIEQQSMFDAGWEKARERAKLDRERAALENERAALDAYAAMLDAYEG